MLINPLFPGATIGIFGSGQLGRMLAVEARRIGYRTATFSPEADSPTGQVADVEVVSAYDDLDAVREFVRLSDVVTFEFENVASAVASIADEEGVPVRPGGHVLHIAQNRIREKTFFVHCGLPVAPFVRVNGLDELQRGVEKLGLSTVLKTASFGYDGKGQVIIHQIDQIESAWQTIGKQNAILETFVPFVKEVSVVAARGLDGEFAHYGVIENIHRDHILDLSISPAQVSTEVASKAIEFAQILFEKLEVVGVLCIEFFLTTDGKLLINEIAPRPHNSGHLTAGAAITNQFEQQLRAVCGLPLGSTELVRPAVMANILGDLWFDGESNRVPNWAAVSAIPNCKVHLYGKHEARPGRKMGHLTVLDEDIEQALETAIRARERLVSTT